MWRAVRISSVFVVNIWPCTTQRVCTGASSLLVLSRPIKLKRSGLWWPWCSRNASLLQHWWQRCCCWSSGEPHASIIYNVAAVCSDIHRCPRARMLLCSLLTLAWLHVCCGRDLAQASSSSDCTTVNTAAELNNALPMTGSGARRLCLDPTDDRYGVLL